MSPQQPQFPITGLSDERKYTIADAIARNCNGLSPDVIKNHRNFYFRDVINSTIAINGTRVTVAQAFDEDTAMHITNLVLNRLSAPRLVKSVASLTFDNEPLPEESQAQQQS